MSEPLPNAVPAGPSVTVRPSIFLDYGVDGAASEDAVCELCERGMRFRSRWQFESGKVLSVAFSFGEDAPRRVEAEGVVIECTQLGCRSYLTTLAFLEVPADLRATLGEVSLRLPVQRSVPCENGDRSCDG